MSRNVRHVSRFIDCSPAEAVAFLGVLDHDVKLPSGETVHNPMRVLPNGRGSELLFSVFQREGMSDEELEADCKTVAADLEKAKSLLETRPTRPSRNGTWGSDRALATTYFRRH